MELENLFDGVAAVCRRAWMHESRDPIATDFFQSLELLLTAAAARAEMLKAPPLSDAEAKELRVRLVLDDKITF